MAEDISKLLATINKSMKGAAVVQPVSEVVTPYHIRRPTGIMDLDKAMKGGWAAGTLSEIFGPDGTGKDMLVNMTMAQNQKIYGEDSNVFTMSFGYKPDLGFMRHCGMQIAYSDQELLNMGIDPETATPEQRGHTVGNVVNIDIGEVSDAQAAPSETLMSAALKLVASDLFQIGIINELGSGETKDNVVKNLDEDAKVATWSRLVSDFLRKYYTINRFGNHTSLIVINPVRANMDARSAKFNKHSIPSGFALKHAKVIDLHIRSGGKIKRGSAHVGKRVVWKISKGKLGLSEGAEGEYDYYFDTGVDTLKILATTARAEGVILSRGKYNDIVLDPDSESEDSVIRISGKLDPVVIDYLRDNPDVADKVRKRVLEV